MNNQKEHPDKGHAQPRLTPLPLEAALVRPVIEEQVTERKRAELQDAANRAIIEHVERAKSIAAPPCRSSKVDVRGMNMLRTPARVGIA